MKLRMLDGRGVNYTECIHRNECLERFLKGAFDDRDGHCPTHCEGREDISRDERIAWVVDPQEWTQPESYEYGNAHVEVSPGDKFGNSLVLSVYVNDAFKTVARMRCSCGSERDVYAAHLTAGRQRACVSCAVKRNWGRCGGHTRVA